MPRKKTTSKAPAKKTATKKTVAKKTTRAKATTKKPAVKKAVKKVVEKKPVEKVEESRVNFKIKVDTKKFKPFVKPVLSILLLVIVLMGADFLVQYLNNDSSIAVVDGERISRSEYLSKLEDMHGDEVAEILVEELVVTQLADSKGVTLTEEDIDEEYKAIEDQFGGAEALEQTLFMYGMTKEELREQLQNQVLMKKIIAPTLEYTEEDLAKFFEENKEFIYPDGEDVTFEDEKENIEKQYIDQKVNEKREEVLAEFKEGIVIQLNTPSVKEEEDRGYGIFKATRNVIKNLFSGDEDTKDTEDAEESEE